MPSPLEIIIYGSALSLALVLVSIGALVAGSIVSGFIQHVRTKHGR